MHNHLVMPDGAAVVENPIADEQIHKELNLPRGKLLWKVKVFGRSKDSNGDITGPHDPNPFLNDLIYDVDFSDGKTKEHSDNVIAENIHSQADENGRNTKILDSIFDHRKCSDAIDKADMRLRTKS